MNNRNSLTKQHIYLKQRSHLVQECHSPVVVFSKRDHFAGSTLISSDERNLQHVGNNNDVETRIFSDFVSALRGYDSVIYRVDSVENDHQWVLNNVDSSTRSKANTLLDLIRCYHSVSKVMSDLFKSTNPSRYVNFLCESAQKGLTAEFTSVVEKTYLQYRGHECPFTAIVRDHSTSVTQLRNFLYAVQDEGLIGGSLLNRIDQKIKTETLPNPLYQILHWTYKCGLAEFRKILCDWLCGVNLDRDQTFEFFIWDLYKQRRANYDFRSGSEENKSLHSVKSELIQKDDFDNFSQRFSVVPQLCPEPFVPLIDSIVLTGRLLYILKCDGNDDTFAAEDFKTCDDIVALSRMVKDRYAVVNCAVLNHIRTAPEFPLLTQRLPEYFFGHNNEWIDEFIEMTEEEWQPVLESCEYREDKWKEIVNEVFKKALSRSNLSKDGLQKYMSIQLQPVYDQLFLRCIDLNLSVTGAFMLAFPPSIFEYYRKLFSIRHRLRRALNILARKHFERLYEDEYRWKSLDSLMHFFQSYDSIVFGAPSSHHIDDFLNNSNSINGLDIFVNNHSAVLKELCDFALLNFDATDFMSNFESLLNLSMDYGNGKFEDEFVIISKMGRNVIRMKKYIRVRIRQSGKSPPITKWLFGSNIQKPMQKARDIEDAHLILCYLLQRTMDEYQPLMLRSSQLEDQAGLKPRNAGPFVHPNIKVEDLV